MHNLCATKCELLFCWLKVKQTSFRLYYIFDINSEEFVLPSREYPEAPIAVHILYYNKHLMKSQSLFSIHFCFSSAFLLIKNINILKIVQNQTVFNKKKTSTPFQTFMFEQIIKHNQEQQLCIFEKIMWTFWNYDFLYYLQQNQQCIPQVKPANLLERKNNYIPYAVRVSTHPPYWELNGYYQHLRTEPALN